MSFDQFPTAELLPPKQVEHEGRASAEQFLGDTQEYIPPTVLEEILERAEQYGETLAQREPAQEVSYNKYKKSFFIGDTPVTAGQILASRHLGATVTLPETLESSLDGKKLRRTYTKAHLDDFIFDELNRELATALAKEVASKDVLKATAYRAIAERSGEGKEHNEQLGVLAEKIVHGVAEMIALDRPDLGITVHTANAYQDVEEKIDFIVATKQKRRGAGIEAMDLPLEEKHVGIQFTINTAKESFKKDQIAKAKERGIDVDDIVYVALDSTLLRNALHAWERAGKPIAGPWAHIPKETKEKAIIALFDTVLTEEQVASLIKHI
ncbi:MAG: hypothetical protein KBB91_01255 [Candidatus Pacebacteria bacterium]|nr:hypothetical protein [Candidatus Paceibacterota bacterium]MBP9701003.1 hypothetical protein [Candidatus Paceibacterota bacterium]